MRAKTHLARGEHTPGKRPDTRPNPPRAQPRATKTHTAQHGATTSSSKLQNEPIHDPGTPWTSPPSPTVPEFETDPPPLPHPRPKPRQTPPTRPANSKIAERTQSFPAPSPPGFSLRSF